MANEYLTRTPTSTGNQRVWTWSGWVKRHSFSDSQHNLWRVESGSSGDSGFRFDLSTPSDSLRFYLNGASNGDLRENPKRRDASSWMNVMIAYDSTAENSSSRVQLFVNGVRIRNFAAESYPTINYASSWNGLVAHRIGASPTYSEYSKQQLSDIFFIDGQALTPDVFGFYKQGNGYISAGSTQATDFRSGQWVPKTPRVIKTEINRRGGFGVNGFYLPMNDSKNFGADFHCDPNSIITLNEKLPQPRVGVATTASVGLGYTDALRADPYAANLVLALPFVSGGLSSGFGDYSAAIKGSGSAKTITNNNVSIGNTASYYGSAANFTSSSSSYLTSSRNITDYNMGSGDFTIEGWFYFKSINTGQYTRVFSIGNGTLESILFELVISTSVLSFYSRDTTNNSNVINGPVIVADQWYHIALCRKSTTVSAYINGVCVGTSDISTRTLNFDSNTALVIGAWENSIGSYTRFTDAYIQDLRIYKGVAKYSGGFDVPKPYTPVGIATWRAVPDTTANNFATLNALDKRSTGLSLSNGNLSLSGGVLNEWSTIKANIGVSTSKWYWEISNINRGVNGGSSFGAVEQSHRVEGDIYIGKVGFGTGYSYGDAGLGGVGASFTTSDVVGIALDMSNGTLTWYKNGVQAQTQSGITGTWIPAISHAQTPPSCTVNFGQNPTFSGNTTAGTFTDSNGKGLFKYQPPSGFLALCEDNLPTPAIKNPGEYFKTVLWTGTGASRNVVGVGFTPDLVWVKERNGNDNHRLVDSVRGATRELYSSLTNVEAIDSGGVLSFDSDGFSLGNGDSYNQISINHVAWCWRAGAGTTSTNTNGSIQSVVSVNQTAGFSIVSWTGTGSGTITVGHGLGKQPAFIITKARDSALDNNWVALHKSVGSSVFSQYLYLNSTVAAGALSPTWPATSTTFTTSPGFNSAVRYISYCWAEIEGFSKAFSYTGNGSTDGPFTFLNFKPAWVIIKRTDSTGNWCIHDSSRSGGINVMNEQLQANLSNVESGTGGLIDFLSNGFKIRSTSTDLNSSGGTYIGMAFAESPFVYSNAK